MGPASVRSTPTRLSEAYHCLDLFPILTYCPRNEDLVRSHSTIDLGTHLHHQLVYALTDLLPSPLEDLPEAIRARSHAAVAKAAAPLPGNASEDAWAQHIAERCVLGVADPDVERLSGLKIEPQLSHRTISHDTAFET